MRLLNIFCSAALVLAVSSSVFASEAITTSKNTMMAPKPSNSCKPVKPACKPVKKAKPCEPCEEPEPCCFFEQGLALEDDVKPPCDVKYHPGYNAAAAISVDNAWDFNVDASFIYWNVSQEAMDVTYVAPLVGSATTRTPGSVVYQDTGYKPGFKVGIGWDTHFDNWALNAEYTWLHQSKNTSATAPGIEIFTANDWFPDHIADPFDAVSSVWKMHMDMVDVVVSRPFYQGTHLTLSPTGGLRGLFLRQTMDVTLSELTAPTSISSANSSHSWAVGPKCGVNSHWLVWRGLRFEGQMDASILYTRYTSIVNTETVAGVGSASSSASDFSAVRPAVDMGLGLGYGAYMFRNSFYFDLAVRYDFSQFWSQNVMRNFASQLQGRDDAIGDLHMHGLTITLRCDF